MAAIRVLIADDHAVVRRGLKLFLDLQRDIEVVGEAGDGRSAIEQARGVNPDVVLMDVAMPRLGGIDATRALVDESSGVRVLVLSSFGGDDHVVPALRAGAAGYVTKDLEPDQLAEAIRTVYQGGSVLRTDGAREAIRRLAAEPGPAGTVTILFTDVEGSTGIVERFGDKEARGILREHDRVLRGVLGEHGGVEVDHEGDAFMFAFSEARPAVLAAVGMQRALEARAAVLPDWAVRVRLGMNTGEVLADQDGYFGKAVFLAARVTAKATGGQILASNATRRLADEVGVRFVAAGRHALKGLSGTHALYEVVWR